MNESLFKQYLPILVLVAGNNIKDKSPDYISEKLSSALSASNGAYGMLDPTNSRIILEYLRLWEPQTKSIYTDEEKDELELQGGLIGESQFEIRRKLRQVHKDMLSKVNNINSNNQNNPPF